MSNLFVNLEITNDEETNKNVSMKQIQNLKVLDNPELWEISIDRFSIHRAWLPIYQAGFHTLSLTILRKSDDETKTIDLDFEPVQDGDGFLWNKLYFQNVFNAGMTSALAHFELELTPIVLTINNDGTGTLNYSAISNFRDDYKLYFNNALYRIFSSFSFYDVVASQDTFLLYTPNTGDKKL